MITYIIAFVVVGFALVLRAAPSWLAPHGIGVDQWIWKAYIEKVRVSGELPPKLPQFLLDEHQWCPPLFPWIMAKLPEQVFEVYSTRVAILIDMLRLGLLLFAARWLSGSDMVMGIAGFAYAMTPLLITYNVQLNPRGLAALFLDAMWLCVAGVILKDEASLWLPAFILAGLILLTHKMTTQLLLFTVFGAVLLSSHWEILLLLPGGFLVAMALSGGYYFNVLRAHIDIVVFWSKNWRWSGSHPILESPVYGEPGFESATKYYKSGLKPWVRRLQFVIGFNPWMPSVLLITLLAVMMGGKLPILTAWIFFWVCMIFLFALLTTLVPAMRCMGQGYLYGYNGGLPAALLLGMSWSIWGQSPVWLGLTALTILASLIALTAYFRALRSSKTIKVETGLDQAIRHLATLPQGTVVCLPQHWHDVVAYRTGKPVAFGGHGYGFKLLQPVFPRWMIPVGEAFEQYGVRYLLTYEGYLNARFEADLPPAHIERFGDYRLYCFEPVAPESPCPREAV